MDPKVKLDEAETGAGARLLLPKMEAGLELSGWLLVVPNKDLEASG